MDRDNITEESVFGSLDGLEAGALSNPPMRPVWIADLLFYRYNRSVKYDDIGNILILNEATGWSQLWPRLSLALPFLVTYAIAVILNFLLFLLSLARARRSDHRKVHCLFANLAFCNVLLSAGFFIYTFLIDVYYDVDSFNTLLNLNAGTSKYGIWPLAKQIIHTEMVDNLALAQSLILLFVSIDRYLSLFENYSPYVRQTVVVWIIAVIPYFLSIFIFDLQLMSMVLNTNLAAVIRLSCFMTPVPLSLVFAVCAVVRLVQHPTSVRRKKDDLSCAATLLFILLLQLIEKFGLFLELLHNNFNFEITVGNRQGDLTLRIILGYIYMTSHYFFLASPVYIPILLLLFVGFYRSRLLRAVKRFWRFITCKPREHLDYSTETMRSIIAEQTRQRQLKSFGY